MSRNTKKSRTTTRTAPTADRGLHVVADNDGPPNGKRTADDKVWTALQDNPGATTATVALTAGVGRSTAAKLLARWDDEGTVTRTPGEGQRSPDTWTIPASGGDDTVNQPAVTDTASGALATIGDDDAPADSAPDADTGIVEEKPSEAPSAAAEEPNTATDTGDADPTVEDVADTQAAPAISDEQQPADSAADAESAAAAVSEKKQRLPKGGLRGLVEDYLAEHPDDSFGPTKIGKDLERSGGAISNALDKLVEDGYAIKTCEAPKRFRYKKQTADTK
ncbi:hypothetical protein [Amycolatopsis sp. NPDC059657]|uniref:hypothetical protein n=1 Tax=Amycolatopsis sp. NPDC059657 TaxID=3346899 RepID=UPI0036704C11